MGIDYSGSSNLRELNYVLRNSAIIRRLKEEVLSELPSKSRQRIQVDVDPLYVELIQKALLGDTSKGEDSRKLLIIMKNLIGSKMKGGEELEEQMDRLEKEGQLRYPKFFECYQYSGLAKLEGIKKYIKEVLEQDTKILVFAHHKKVLEGIEEIVASAGVKYIKIDGAILPQKRFEQVKIFQENEDVKVGILSLTAGGLGLTLTAAPKVIFAEVTLILYVETFVTIIDVLDTCNYVAS